MMKRIGAVALTAAVAGTLVLTALAQEPETAVPTAPDGTGAAITVNGTALDLTGLPAGWEGLPMRLIAESDHGSASWFPEENLSSFSIAGAYIQVSFADGTVTVDDALLEGVTAQVVDGVTFLPASVFDGLEGFSVTSEGGSVAITTPNGAPLVQLAYAVADAANVGYGMSVDAEALTAYGIDGSNFEEVAGFFPMITSPDTVIVGKVAEGKLDALTEQLDAYRQQQYDTFSWYLSQNLPKVEDARTVTSGDYILFLIGENADAGVAAFESGVEALQAQAR